MTQNITSVSSVSPSTSYTPSAQIKQQLAALGVVSTGNLQGDLALIATKQAAQVNEPDKKDGKGSFKQQLARFSCTGRSFCIRKTE